MEMLTTSLRQLADNQERLFEQIESVNVVKFIVLLDNNKLTLYSWVNRG